MRWRIPAGVGVAALVAVVAASRIGRGPTVSSPSDAPTSRPATPARTGVPPDALARWDELERREQESNRTTWAPELLAQRHEQQVIGWWDRLRAGADFVGVLGDAGFRAVGFPRPGAPEELGGGIRRRRLSGDPSPVTGVEWKRMLEGFRAGGWVLDGSEWRMPGFRPASGADGATGWFDVELHALQPSVPRRGILRGRLRVQWRPPSGEEVPGIDTVVLERAEWLERDGEPPFSTVLRADVAPLAGSVLVDPLLVSDLDGDGRDDLVLAARNQVYRNRGGGGFTVERLVPGLTSPVVGAVLADFDGDGRPDFLGAQPGGLVLARGDGRGHFDGPVVAQALDNLANPFVVTAGDVDGDGDLDVWIGQYKVPYRHGQMPVPFHDANDGFPAYLLLNDGHGNFTDATTASGLGAKRWRRAYSASLVDVDGDGSLDLVVASDFAGVDLYLNDGRGRFRDATGTLPEPRLFGMSQVVADFDGDGRADLLALGMDSPVARRMASMGLGPTATAGGKALWMAFAHGNRAWVNRGGGRMEAAPWADEVAATGWSWGAAVADLDNDGTEEVYVVNGHKSGPSAREYEPQFWMHDIHVAGGTNLDAGLDLYFRAVASRRYGAGESYGGHQRNRLLWRGSDGHRVDVAWLWGVALPDDCRNLVATDLDGDGRPDLVVTAERLGARPGHELVVLRNGGAAGNWVALRLDTVDGGRDPGVVRVELETDRGRRVRWRTLGNAYRSQESSTVHFGLAAGEKAVGFRVTGAGGRTWRVEASDPVRVLRP